MKLIPLHPKTRRDGSLSEPILMNAEVDDEDYDDLIHYTWYYKEDNLHTRYHKSVGRNPIAHVEDYEKDSLVMMSHHVLKNHIKGFRVSYRDGDPKNNQKENLKVVLDGHDLVELRQHWIDQMKPRVQLEMDLPR